MLIDIHSHQRAEATPELLRLGAYRPTEELPEGLDVPFTYGLHPCFADDITPEGLARLQRVIESEPLLWGLGELGLDKLSPVPFALQLEYFDKQIELSERYGYPLIIHCVRAWSELLAVYRRLRPRQPWVVHGFRKSRALAEELLSEGLYLSFGEHYQAEALCLAYGRGRLLIETDESILPLECIYRRMAETLDCPIEELIGRVGEIFLSLRSNQLNTQ